MARYSWKFCFYVELLFLILCSLCSEAARDDAYYMYLGDSSAEYSPYEIEFKKDASSLVPRLKRATNGSVGVGVGGLDHQLLKTLQPTTFHPSMTTYLNSSQANATAAPQDASNTSSVRINDKVHKLNLNPKTNTLESSTDSTVQDTSSNVQNSSIDSNESNKSEVPNNKVPLPNPKIIAAEFEPGTKISNPLKEMKEDEDDIFKFNQELNNKTYADNQITRIVQDSHIYYNSTFQVDPKKGQSYWVYMDNNPNVTVHELLSQSHRRAATVKLSFDFPYYGHMVRNVTIATGGFVYTGDQIHVWLAATQYIAPLMANFDTRMSKDSFVKYVDNGSAFTVLWENVMLKDSPDFGKFSFQMTLHKNGDIVFVYKEIPTSVEQIKDDQHPVKVGLADAYIIDRNIFFVKRKTIYEYHHVHFNKEDIKNWTVIYLSALPTCLDLKDCDSCLQANNNQENSGTSKDYDTRKCNWCPSVNRCSTGLDRLRQQWLDHECDKVHTTSCVNTPPPPFAHHADVDAITVQHIAEPHSKKTNVPIGLSGIMSVMLLVLGLAAVGCFLAYAYANPHSTSGQLLIRYRPSQWRWRRGEARYTAATIHM
ncbi:plexin domain-containing protein 1 isoform X2 [Nilaparvata lugens]|uniref:plexin domain-containing protein 1 isoform X2 n=1 Tax=Nilaparvata lugens TaxID=108931 RepID=UPI00193CA67D|nr:plexin domain-containing protein 1 isoform X2 [Nilaparvata lugens]